MPDRLWNRYFAAWYVPPPPHEIHREALRLEPRAPRKRLPDGRRVCFFGDSQMRHLFNNFVMATSDYAAVPVESAAKQVMPSDLHTYVVKRWSGFGVDEGAEVAIDSLPCTDFVANMGQWPAGWPEDRPWGFEEYDRAVRADMAELRALSAALGVRLERFFYAATQSPFRSPTLSGRPACRGR